MPPMWSKWPCVRKTWVICSGVRPHSASTVVALRQLEDSEHLGEIAPVVHVVIADVDERREIGTFDQGVAEGQTKGSTIMRAVDDGADRQLLDPGVFENPDGIFRHDLPPCDFHYD